MKNLERKKLESLLNSRIDEVNIIPIYKDENKTEVEEVECEIKFKTNIQYIEQLLDICKP
jgi:hypothetical protein